VGRFLSTLRGFGFESLSRPAEFYGDGLALGNGEVTLLELANAYAALARGGLWAPARLLEDGSRPAFRRALPSGAAWLVADVLSDNGARSRAFGWNSPFRRPYPLAAKTGTSKDYRDNWAVGFTPDWTVAVWVGNFDGSPMRRVSGITGAGPLLRDAVDRVAARWGARPFPRPPSVRESDVCPASGLLQSLDCPSSVAEVFTRASLPSATCALHASVSTPPASANAPRVTFPVDGDVFQRDPHAPAASQLIHFQGDRLPEDARWRLDGRPSPEWCPLTPGPHTVQAEWTSQGHPRRTRPIRFLVVR
jgi:penicillin-binding protein 1C